MSIDPNSIFKPGFYRETPGDGFTEEERRWAKNLLKGDNLERLERAKKTGRRFRPVPVTIFYEVWWVGGDALMHGGWRMARIENGRRSDHSFVGDVLDEVNRLKAAGFSVKEIPIEGAPPLHPPSRGSFVKRKAFSERFGDLRGV